MDLGDIHRGNVIDAPFDIRDLIDRSVVLELVGMDEAKVDPLHVEQVFDVVVRAW
jgi:hypothetical protein